MHRTVGVVKNLLLKSLNGSNINDTIWILISGNVKKGPHLYNATLDVVEQNDKKGQRFFNVASDVMEQNQANRLAKHLDRFNQDKLFGKFQKLRVGSVKQGGSGEGKECS